MHRHNRRFRRVPRLAGRIRRESVGPDSRVRPDSRAPCSSVRARSRPTRSARSRPICDRRRGHLELEGAIARKCDGLLQAGPSRERSDQAPARPGHVDFLASAGGDLVAQSSDEESSERRFRTSRHRARDKRRPSERLARARARLLHPRTGARLSGGSPPVAVGSAGGNQASRLDRAAPAVPADPTATSARSTLLLRTEPSAESSFRSATSTRTAVTRGRALRGLQGRGSCSCHRPGA